MDNKNKKTGEIALRRLTADVPLDVYSRVNRLKEDLYKKGKKFNVSAIIVMAINSLSKELGYPEIPMEH